MILAGHNHRASCLCPWCIDNKPNILRNAPQICTSDENIEYNLINPNSKCPVCGDTVYFYRSSNGGKVYFDEIGYPWTKHPCTNSENKQKNTKMQIINTPNINEIMEQYEIVYIKEYKKIRTIGKYDIPFYKKIISDSTTSIIILTYIFFRFYNDIIIRNKIIKHKQAKIANITNIYKDIVKLGFYKFQQKFYKNYSHYEDVVGIFKSVKHIPFMDELKKIIQKKQNIIFPKKAK